MMDEQHMHTPETEERQAEAVPEAVAGPSSEDYQELNNRYLRLAADFENFRKRQAQEREHLFKYGSQSSLEALLPVIDNLERARQSLSENSDPKMLYKSFEMMSNQLLDSLKDIGLAKMEAKGAIFDPERHEAVAQTEKADVPDHTILEVYQDGYLYHDKVLRPASVVVSVAPVETGPPAGGFEPAKAELNQNPFQQSSPGQGGH